MAQIKISEVSCAHCIDSIKKTLENAGANHVQIDPETGITSWGDSPSADEGINLIKNIGFASSKI